MKVRNNEVRKPKANFVRMNIDIKEEPTVSFWVGFLTMLPFPLVLIKAFAGVIAEQISKHTEFKITKNQLLDILNACDGLVVNVETDDVNIDIKFN